MFRSLKLAILCASFFTTIYSFAKSANITCNLTDAQKQVPVQLKEISSGVATLQIGDQEPEKVLREISMKLSAAQVDACAEAFDGALGDEEKCLASHLDIRNPYQLEVARIYHAVRMYPPNTITGFDTSQVANATGYFVSKAVPEGNGTAFVELSDSKGQVLGHLMSFGFGVGAIVDCKPTL